MPSSGCRNMNERAQACLQKAEECEHSAQRTGDESARPRDLNGAPFCQANLREKAPTPGFQNSGETATAAQRALCKPTEPCAPSVKRLSCTSL